MKYTIFGGLVLLAVAGLTFAFGNLSRPEEGPAEAIEGTRVPDYTWAEMRAIAERSDELEEGMVRMRRFSAGFTEVRADVWARKVSPWAAADRTLELARDHAPIYLRSAGTLSPGFGDRDAVLLAILRHMQSEPQTIGSPADRTEDAFEEIVCELFASAETTPALQRAIDEVVFPALPATP